MTHQPGDEPSGEPGAPPPTTPFPAAPYPSGYPAPGGYGGAPPPPPGLPTGYYPGPLPYRLPDHPKATQALVLGIIALLGGLTCYLPLLLGPWAWAAGRRAVREIDAEPGRYDGRGQAMAGYVLGVVATVVLLLAVVALVGFLVFVLGMFTWDAPGGDGQYL